MLASIGLLGAGGVGIAGPLGIHIWEGRVQLSHLAPACAAGFLHALALGLSYPYL